jgi:hypothetical protein
MAITLEDAHRVAGTDVDREVIDSFRKSSWLLNNIIFDDLAAPTGGATIDYTYSRLKTQPVADFRRLNEDYPTHEVEVETHTVSCKPLGGSFTVDRVIAAVGNGSRVALEVEQKIKATKAKFANAFINGDADLSTGKEFDGLAAALAGTTTENTGAFDLTGATTAQEALVKLEALETLLAEIDSEDGAALLMNARAKQRILFLARLAGHADTSLDGFGRRVDTYRGIPLVDLGARDGSNDPVIANTVIDGGTGPASTTTGIYAVRFGLDAVHAVSPAGLPLVRTFLPKFEDGNAEAVQRGSVEMVASLAVKQTKAAAVLTNVRVA